MIENVLDQETRHEIRYHVQYVFLPKLVESVSEGYLPSIALFTFAPWYYNLRQYYDIKELKAAGVYEEFEKYPYFWGTIFHKFYKDLGKF